MVDEHSLPVVEWHRIVNERDTVAARKIVTDDVAVGGPRGAATGVETFVSWIESAGIHLVPVSWHLISEEMIIVEQQATWPSQSKAGGAAPQMVATLFVLRGHRIASSLRFGSVSEAASFARSQ
jgi:hypothetical protein